MYELSREEKFMANEQSSPCQPKRRKRRKPETRLERSLDWLERHFEAFLFASRWLAAPIYFGLVLGLFLLLIKFFYVLKQAFEDLYAHPEADAVSSVLSFIDIALVTNLMLIVILAGYEHFVSKIDTGDDPDRPGWMSTVGFAGLKLKLFASIIAITGIELLKAFTELRDGGVPDVSKLTWLIAIHVTFLFTAVLSSVADWLSSRVEPPDQPEDPNSFENDDDEAPENSQPPASAIEPAL